LAQARSAIGSRPVWHEQRPKVSRRNVVIPVVAEKSRGEDQEMILRSILAESFVEFLASCGQSAELVDEPDHVPVGEHHVAGFIGFTGVTRGSLVITASSALYRITYPLGPGTSMATSPGDILDWAREMANQTLGRVKRRFCQRGVDFDVTTPSAVSGSQIERRRSRPGVLDLLFRIGAEAISVGFEIVMPDDGVIFRHNAAPIPCSSEGDVVMF